MARDPVCWLFAEVRILRRKIEFIEKLSDGPQTSPMKLCLDDLVPAALSAPPGLHFEPVGKVPNADAKFADVLRSLMIDAKGQEVEIAKLENQFEELTTASSRLNTVIMDAEDRWNRKTEVLKTDMSRLRSDEPVDEKDDEYNDSDFEAYCDDLHDEMMTNGTLYFEGTNNALKKEFEFADLCRSLRTLCWKRYCYTYCDDDEGSESSMSYDSDGKGFF